MRFKHLSPVLMDIFLVCLHCNSKRKLQALVLMLMFVCVFVIAQGYLDLRHVVPQGAAPQPAANRALQSQSVEQ